MELLYEDDEITAVRVGNSVSIATNHGVTNCTVEVFEKLLNRLKNIKDVYLYLIKQKGRYQKDIDFDLDDQKYS